MLTVTVELSIRVLLNLEMVEVDELVVLLDVLCDNRAANAFSC